MDKNTKRTTTDKKVNITLRLPPELIEAVMSKSYVFPGGEYERGEKIRAFEECLWLGVEARDGD